MRDWLISVCNQLKILLETRRFGYRLFEQFFSGQKCSEECDFENCFSKYDLLFDSGISII